MKQYCCLFIVTTVFGWAVSAASAQPPVPTGWAPDGSFRGSFRIGLPRYERVVIGQPYSGQLMDQRVERLPDGKLHTYYAGMQKIWRDSQGRFRMERKFCAKGAPHTTDFVWNPACPTIIEVRDPVNGSYYTWDSINHVVHRLPLPAAPVAPARQPAPDSTPPVAAPSRTLESLGVKTIDGVEARGTRYVTVYPAGTLPRRNTEPLTVSSEEWFAPDLQIRMLATTDDPQFGLMMIDKFEDFTRSEPDPNLFVPPPGFQILEEMEPFYITWGGVKQFPAMPANGHWP